jgi:hypothetical protein
MKPRVAPDRQKEIDRQQQFEVRRLRGAGLVAVDVELESSRERLLSECPAPDYLAIRRQQVEYERPAKPPVVPLHIPAAATAVAIPKLKKRAESGVGQ